MIISRTKNFLVLQKKQDEAKEDVRQQSKIWQGYRKWQENAAVMDGLLIPQHEVTLFFFLSNVAAGVTDTT